VLCLLTCTLFVKVQCKRRAQAKGINVKEQICWHGNHSVCVRVLTSCCYCAWLTMVQAASLQEACRNGADHSRCFRMLT
jgi:hypothetical protein